MTLHYCKLQIAKCKMQNILQFSLCIFTFALSRLYRLRDLFDVTDALPFDHEYHHFGDVGGMIGDPLEIFRDEPDLHRPIDRMRVFDHEAYGLTEDLAVEIVHLLVFFTNFERQVRILADESVQTLPNHPPGGSRHAREVG